MRLMDRKVERFVISITPEMKERIQELDQSVLNDMKKVSSIATQSMELQTACMMAATELGN